jgi:hypothetical protein
MKHITAWQLHARTWKTFLVRRGTLAFWLACRLPTRIVWIEQARVQYDTTTYFTVRIGRFWS